MKKNYKRKYSVDCRSRSISKYSSALTTSQSELLGKDNECSSINERLNETQSELRKALDDLQLAEEKYDTLIKERDVLVEQQKLLSADK